MKNPFLIFVSITFLSAIAFATTAASKATYDVQILENGNVTGVGSEVHTVVGFDPASQVYRTTISREAKMTDGSILTNSYSGQIGRNQEQDHNFIVETCASMGVVGAVRETIKTTAGTFDSCRGYWGLQKPDGSLVTTTWIGKNARGFAVKVSVESRTSKGLVSDVMTLRNIEQ